MIEGLPEFLRASGLLFVRALREDARRSHYHLLRLAFVAIVLWMVFQAHIASSLIGAPGLQFFQSISYLNLVGITLVGLGFFASAITEEKEEGMLGLLTLAGIGPLSILLGKSTSRLVSAVLLLSVQFPFTLLAITLGGVTWGQVLAAYCALLAYMVVLANLALLFSVICRNTFRAACLTAASLVGYYLVCPGSVLTRLNRVMTTGFSERAIDGQVVCSFAAALLLFFLAWLVFDRFNREELAVVESGQSWQGRTRICGPSIPRPREDPLAWKEYYFLTGGRRMLILRFVTYPILIAACAYLIRDHWSVRNSLLRSVVASTVLVPTVGSIVESTWFASRILRVEITSHSLPLLQLLPGSLAMIPYYKFAGCTRALLPAASYCVGGILLGSVLIDPAILIEALMVVLCLSLPVAWFLHIVVFLSLQTRGGAILLASLGVLLLCALFGSCLLTVIILLPLSLFVLPTAGIASLRYAIERRLQKLAAE